MHQLRLLGNGPSDGRESGRSTPSAAESPPSKGKPPLAIHHPRRDSTSDAEEAKGHSHSEADIKALLTGVERRSQEQVQEIRKVLESRTKEVEASMQADERKRMEQIERNLVETLGSQLGALKSELSRGWEEQRAEAMRKYNELEAARAEMLRKVITREEEVHAAQSQVIKKLQQKASATLDGVPAIEDLRATNKALKDVIAARASSAERGPAHGCGRRPNTSSD